jgi:hypothetical protein
MAGSFMSGFISVYSGYDVTFVLSGVTLFAAVYVVTRLPKPPASGEGAHQ